ncbi:MAG TPA: TfoX/Sxy family protein [Candidatus Dormibacteraeota bacterium]|jgi:TfoX/Sxy family transcriptional regulator of competence genes|nr:TfoX/Sxy family protein [Candidatus Dormibacteraeota bacterium]
MSVDEGLADRLRELLAGEEGLSERTMFGGLTFLVHGNMAVSASGRGGLLVRIDPAQTETLLGEPHTEPAVMRGWDMTGWLRVGADAVRDRNELERWARIGVAQARSLPTR